MSMREVAEEGETIFETEDGSGEWGWTHILGISLNWLR